MLLLSIPATRPSTCTRKTCDRACTTTACVHSHYSLIVSCMASLIVFLPSINSECHRKGTQTRDADAARQSQHGAAVRSFPVIIGLSQPVVSGGSEMVRVGKRQRPAAGSASQPTARPPAHRSQCFAAAAALLSPEFSGLHASQVFLRRKSLSRFTTTTTTTTSAHPPHQRVFVAHQ